MSSQMIARQKLYAEIAELEAELEGWRQVADEVPLLPKYKALVELEAELEKSKETYKELLSQCQEDNGKLRAENTALVEAGDILILAAGEYGLNRCWNEAKTSWRALLEKTK